MVRERTSLFLPVKVIPCFGRKAKKELGSTGGAVPWLCRRKGGFIDTSIPALSRRATWRSRYSAADTNCNRGKFSQTCRWPMAGGKSSTRTKKRETGGSL